jgi:hypothetical protein
MEITPNYAKLRNCINCNFKCYKNVDWDRHINTTKHKNRTNLNILEQNTPIVNKFLFTCKKCNKEYKARNSLWYHEKKCNSEQKIENENIENENIELENDITDKELIVMLIKQNSELMKETSEFKSIMMEVIKNGTHNNITTHTNSHNKAFNLNFFLNETCKDAMNITDFVDSIKLQLSDLEGVGELGYVEGISNIIIKNLKGLDVTQRPVHCTDKKRETMYIKDEDKWEKDEEKKKLHKVVRKVTCKNQNLIPKFKEKHPDCNTYHSKFSDQYNKIIIESMGGKGDNDYEKEEKIIKNISKQVFIDKEQVL